MQSRIPYLMSDDTTLGIGDFNNYYRFVFTASRCIATLPKPITDLARSNREWVFTNTSTGYVSVAEPNGNGFVNSLKSIPIGPGESIILFIQKDDYDSSDCYWAVSGGKMSAVMEGFTPTLSWTGTDPASVATTATKTYIDGFVFASINITSSDGNGATALTVTTPVTLPDYDVEIPISAQQTVGSGTPVDMQAYIDCKNDTDESRLIEFRNFQTCTDGSSFSIWISFFYPQFGTSDWTVAETWTTGTPGSITEVGKTKLFGEWVYGLIGLDSDDSNGASAISATLPVDTKDIDVEVPWEAIWTTDDDGASQIYEDPILYLDLDETAGASRILEEDDSTTATDAQLVGLYTQGFIPWTELEEYDVNGEETWTTGTPASLTSKMKYTIENNMVIGAYYASSADGNGATALEVPLPTAVENCGVKIMCCGQQKVGSTWSKCLPYIDASNSVDSTRRKIQFKNLSTCTDGSAVVLRVFFWYPLG